ncbi:type II toxin-antitoxin system Phd/YefM family antitoxin [Agitococcus lubricus]|uniref:Antitoxin n=1 Tax=Agitococcus lubricus TaxID=1077255 RepID=A0A2T5J484_9GAMM|nr:type II toxin-antitoxin system Phd/YefM family antitoxin [Agitococcus lubricus]PTQ91313.1 prevent-host-death family protein [Agitococcus lubricus]
MLIISSREFNQDLGRAKKSSLSSPVVITERGKPTHVLLSYDDYQHMLTQQPKITDLLALEADIAFEPSKTLMTLKTVDLD